MSDAVTPMLATENGIIPKKRKGGKADVVPAITPEQIQQARAQEIQAAYHLVQANEKALVETQQALQQALWNEIVQYAASKGFDIAIQTEPLQQSVVLIPLQQRN